MADSKVYIGGDVVCTIPTPRNVEDSNIDNVIDKVIDIEPVNQVGTGMFERTIVEQYFICL